jgi:hypothetical protein
MYPGDFSLCDRWITIDLFKYKKVPAPKSTSTQTLKTVTECVVPAILLDFKSSQPSGYQVANLIAIP